MIIRTKYNDISKFKCKPYLKDPNVTVEYSQSKIVVNKHCLLFMATSVKKDNQLVFPELFNFIQNLNLDEIKQTRIVKSMEYSQVPQSKIFTPKGEARADCAMRKLIISKMTKCVNTKPSLENFVKIIQGSVTQHIHSKVEI